MSMDTSALLFPKHAPRVIETARKASEHDRKLAKAYAAVNVREDNRCQVTGVPLTPRTANERRLRDHHHLTGRRVAPEWTYRPERILLVSRLVHRLLESNALLPDGCDARKPIKFAWNRRLIKAGREPMRLRPEVAA